MLKELADNLARMHLGHWQHGCLYGKHVFVKVIGEGEKARAEVALLDWKSAAGASVASAQPSGPAPIAAPFVTQRCTVAEPALFYQMAFGSAVKGLEQ